MELIIKEKEIQKRVEELAADIVKEHKASGDIMPPVMICVLNGGFMFFTDLIRNMNLDIQVDFIRAKSYKGQDNSGGVEFTKELEIHCKGKRVYIVDDIVDTGNTMFEVLLKVNDMKPVETKIVTLLKRKENSPPVDHFCFEIDKEWVVGYGLDDNSLRRNYNNIYKIN